MASVQEKKIRERGMEKIKSSATDVLRFASDSNGWKNMARSMAPVKKKTKKMSTLTNDV